MGYRNFHNTIAKTWSANPTTSSINSFAHFVAQTRHNLIRWKSSNLTSLDVVITNMENDIKAFEMLDVSPYCLNAGPRPITQNLQSLYNRYHVLLTQNSLRWAQRANMLWIRWGRGGGMNTSFYHKFANIRRHKNRISAILDTHGNVCSNQDEIEKCFIDFYFAQYAFLSYFFLC